jgi:hypothetical protein
VTTILHKHRIGGVTFYEKNGYVNDRRMIILEHQKRTIVVAVVPDSMAM